MEEKTQNKGTEVSHPELSDYEYKSWSYGVPVPDGWERCPGDKVDVIRRLKAQPAEFKDSTVAERTQEKVCQHKVQNKNQWEPWDKPCGGCC